LQIVNLGYRFRQDDFNNQGVISRVGINQSDFSFLWPIAKDWSIVGRWQYSFEDSLTLDSFLGLELDSCCWRFRIIGRRFVSNIDNNTGNSKIEPDNAVFFQFELKGLSSFGEDVEEFLERQISGYRRP
jgi:LPS-assembly protein